MVLEVLAVVAVNSILAQTLVVAQVDMREAMGQMLTIPVHQDLEQVLMYTRVFLHYQPVMVSLTHLLLLEAVRLSI
jgi:hypothetical protein